MSSVTGFTTELLERIAAMQVAIGEGRYISLGEALGVADATPEAIKEALGRAGLNDLVPELVKATVGDSMTIGDETALAAAFERAVQGCRMSRIRHMAHHQGRALGHGDAQGILRYGIPEMMARPQ